MSGLLLSLFPGIGLLDMAFEEEGFCVVRGPDLLWGGEIKRFHPPANKFDGVIGGPPCQAFSQLRHIVEANGYKTAENLIPEFERCVGEAQPTWFLMENVPRAPTPAVKGYNVKNTMIRDVWVGGATSRERRFSFGTTAGLKLDVETLALHRPDPDYAVTCDARERPVALLSGGRAKKPRESGGRSSSLNRGGGSLPFPEMCRRQGLPKDFLNKPPILTMTGKRIMVGNGVPLPMGRAVAKAVKRALMEHTAMNKGNPE